MFLILSLVGRDVVWVEPVRLPAHQVQVQVQVLEGGEPPVVVLEEPVKLRVIVVKLKMMMVVGWEVMFVVWLGVEEEVYGLYGYL